MPYDLDHGALQALLDALGTDPSDAAHAYENLRERLIRFFRWNHCLSPEDLADAALDRLAAKLAGGSQAIHQPAGFVAGIARMMLHEQHAQSVRERKVLSLLSWAMENRNRRDEVSQVRHDALDHCLKQIEVENRNLLDHYYSGSARERIRNRQTLADELGVGLNALRNRALRLRRQLERCMSGQMDKLGERDSSRLSVTHRDKRSG